jgi:hypothetical protein
MGNGGGAWRQCIPGEWEEGESEGEICPAVHFSFFRECCGKRARDEAMVGVGLLVA